jgi:hypothetical protein
VDEQGLEERVDADVAEAESEDAGAVAADDWVRSGRGRPGRREGRAGIQWFRVPKDTILVGQAGPAIDVIQRHHATPACGHR